MESNRFTSENVKVGDNSSFQQGHNVHIQKGDNIQHQGHNVHVQRGDNYHAPVTINNNSSHTLTSKPCVRTALHNAVAAGDQKKADELLKEGADIMAYDAQGYTPLNLAIWNGDDDMVKFLLDRNAEVEDTGPAISALHAAILNGNREIAELLLDRGANVEGRVSGNTCLAVAASKGEEELVDLLLERGAKVNARNMTGKSPLYMAAMVGKDAEIVKKLLQHGAKPTPGDRSGGILRSPLLQAAQAFSTGGLKEALEASAQEDLARTVKMYGFAENDQAGKDKALLHFARTGRLPEAKYVLERGARVVPEGGYSGNALVLAVLGGFEEMARLMLEHGADVNMSCSPQQHTSLLYTATGTSSTKMIKLLLSKGADPNAKTRNGRTPLHEAVQKASTEQITLLIDAGVDLEAREQPGGSALDYAVIEQKLEAVQLLLDRGAQVTIGVLRGAIVFFNENILRLLVPNSNDIAEAFRYALDRKGMNVLSILLEGNADIAAEPISYSASILDRAVTSRSTVLVKLLLDKSSDSEANIICRTKALQKSAGNEDIQRMILQRKVDFRLKDQEGVPILPRAAFMKDTILVRLLLEAGADAEIDIRTNKGSTALHVAVFFDLTPMARILIDYGADIAAVNNAGYTALHITAIAGCETTARLLLSKNADANAKDKEGKTARKLAKEQGKTNMVQLLSDR